MSANAALNHSVEESGGDSCHVVDSVNGESSVFKVTNVCSGDQDYMDSDNGMGPVPEEDVQVKHLRGQVDFLQQRFCKANRELVD